MYSIVRTSISNAAANTSSSSNVNIAVHPPAALSSLAVAAQQQTATKTPHHASTIPRQQVTLLDLVHTSTPLGASFPNVIRAQLNVPLHLASTSTTTTAAGQGYTKPTRGSFRLATG
jgi:hypothetical protein